MFFFVFLFSLHNAQPVSTQDRLSAPEVRAFGAGALLCFSLFLIPLTNSSPVLWMFALTKRRARRWHNFNCRLLLVLLLVHGIGMVCTLPTLHTLLRLFGDMPEN